jgi:uncharacterized protein (DUF1697 family)
MIYVALLRSINVGGKNKVDMKRLATTFERAGMRDVRTYLNTGNVIFETSEQPTNGLATRLEDAIEEDVGFHIKVLLRDSVAIAGTTAALPDAWVNDPTMKCDVMFLWDEVDRPAIIDELPIKPEIEDVFYAPGAVIWRVDRANVTKSGLVRIVGTKLYKKMTIRNCNTLRKIAELMAPDDDGQR